MKLPTIETVEIKRGRPEQYDTIYMVTDLIIHEGVIVASVRHIANSIENLRSPSSYSNFSLSSGYAGKGGVVEALEAIQTEIKSQFRQFGFTGRCYLGVRDGQSVIMREAIDKERGGSLLQATDCLPGQSLPYSGFTQRQDDDFLTAGYN